MTTPTGQQKTRNGYQQEAGSELSHETGDEGSAIIETVFLTVLILIPIVYIAFALIRIQATSMAVDHAARDAGRAIDLASSLPAAVANAMAISTIDVHDQGLSTDGLSVTFHTAGSGCSGPAVSPSQRAGDIYDVCVRVRLHLLFFPNALQENNWVEGAYTLHVGELREGPGP